MFFAISKLLRGFLFPATWVIGLLVVAALVRNKHTRNVLLIVAALLLLVFTSRPLLRWAQYRSTAAYTTAAPPRSHYAVAIVMGGFGYDMNPVNGQFCPYRDRGSRLWEALRLYQSGVVDKLLITGDITVYTHTDGRSQLPLLRQYLQQMGLPDSCLIPEPHALNTRQNATYSVALLDSLGYTAQDCLLITSASHMRRSLGCFAAVGWQPDSYAVNCYPRPQHLLWNEYLPSWEPLTLWDELIAEWAGNAVYRMVGYKK